MRAALLVLVVGLAIAVVTAVPTRTQKIVGGTTTTINSYPYAVALLYSWDGVSYFSQSCGGTILTTTAILTAAHCTYSDSAANWRGRVGSSYASSGGTVHTLRSISVHQSFNYYTLDNDVSVLRTSTSIVYSSVVAAASIAGSSYNLPDNASVYAIGWGTTSSGGYLSEQLRHVQIWTVNQSVCKSRYGELGYSVTDNMLCSGWLDVGGRDQCQGDSGGPLIHNNVIVGICSWGNQCALPRYPGVNTRVSRFTSWIQSAAS